MLTPTMTAVLNALSVLAAALSLYLAVVVARMKIRNAEHGILVAAAGTLFAWNSVAYAVNTSYSADTVAWLIPVWCILMFLFVSLHLHFALTLLRPRMRAHWIPVLIYVPAAAFAVLALRMPIGVELGNASVADPAVAQASATPVNLLWLVYAGACFLVPLFLYERHHRLTTVNRHRRQTALLSWWVAGVFVLVFGEYALNRAVPAWDLPMQSPLFMSVWAAGVLYAIWKYGFLKISPAVISEEILDEVEDLVVLYTVDGQLSYMNRRAAAVLGAMRRGRAAAPESLRRALTQYLGTPASWRADEPSKRFRLRLARTGSTAHNETGCNETCYLSLEMHARPLFDQFRDPVGILLTATVLADCSEALTDFGVTAREAEVFECLAAGWTIRRTAQMLAISQRTVKAHISHLYLKTGASNRVELVNTVGV